MIRELSEFGKKKRSEVANGRIVHDALIIDNLDLIISISKDGCFKNIYQTERKTIIEDVIRTEDKGRTSGIVPRLLVDKAQYVIGYPKNNKRSIECHKEFISKLKNYTLSALMPVFSFYNNPETGIDKAYNEFDKLFQSKLIADGNIAFLIDGDDNVINENEDLLKAVIDNYEKSEIIRKGANNQKCSLCGSIDYRINNIATHGVIKRVPDGQTSGCALVTYNADAFESYSLLGNDNASICTHCIKNYTEGLNWLMTDGQYIQVAEKNGKTKERFIYSQRKNFNLTDTAFIFWTKNNQKCSELDLFDNPDPKEISLLIDSVTSGKASHPDSDYFYSCTLSGAAARIAVRDWIEISLDDLKKSIACWFKDIRIEAWGESYHAPLYRLVNAAQNEKNKNETTSSRIAVHLWNAALKNTSPPLWILTSVLKRVRIMENDENKKGRESITPERAALIRLILNRNNKGGFMIKENLDHENTDNAYVCGRIFAVLESIQRAALGKDINAGIRERFFSFASTNPSPAFGRLMKMSQNHLTKLKGEKAGLAVILDKELAELFCKINEFPAVFSLEEQGQFAIGYYHQKQDTYSRAKQNKELKDAVEDVE